MSIWKQFIVSFYNFKMLAAFRIVKFNRVIAYIFLLMLLILLLIVTNMFLTNSSIDSSLYDSVEGIPISKTVITFVSIPFIYIAITGLMFLYITFVSAIGLFLSSARKRKLLYKQAWTITAFAITAPTLILVIIELSTYHIPHVGWIYFMLSIVYISITIRYIPKRKDFKK